MTDTSAVAIPTLEDMQAGMNDHVQRETARTIGELTLRAHSAEGQVNVWQGRARALEQNYSAVLADLDAARAELEATRGHHETTHQELHQARTIAAAHAEELAALKAAPPKPKAPRKR